MTIFQHNIENLDEKYASQAIRIPIQMSSVEIHLSVHTCFQAVILFCSLCITKYMHRAVSFLAVC